MASNGYPQQGESTSPATTTMTASQPPVTTVQPPDQVGWYFVEQYYTILGKNPDQVSLFYNKRSSLVWGTEGEVQPMVQGRHEISERIKSLNFKDCKVRVTNVDSQASAGGGILIQVMGEMINDQGPCQRFAQTFFLAEQPNGYFVLNDIFRYLKEEEDEDEEEEGEGLLEENAEEEVLPEEEEAALESEVVPVEETPVEEPVKESEDTSVSTEAEPEPEQTKPEEPVSIAPAVPEIPAAVPTANEITNGSPAVEEGGPESEPVVEEPETVPEPAEEALPSPPAPKAEPADVTLAQPTPVATPPLQQTLVEKPAAPAPIPAPAKPATWASLLVSKTKPAVSPAPQATHAPPVSQQLVQAPQSNTAAAATTPTSASSGQGWQNVPDNSRRPSDAQTKAYIKFPSENYDTTILKNKLSEFGLKQFKPDEAKGCIYVEFLTAAGFKKARGASPLLIGDQNIHIDGRPRMDRPGRYGPRNPAGGQRGGERQGQGRGGFQRVEGRDSREGGRGGVRGGSGRAFPRGRGSATATN